MKKYIIAIAQAFLMYGTAHSQYIQNNQIGADSTSLNSLTQLFNQNKQLIPSNNSSNTTRSIDLSSQNIVCQPGPDGWLHTYGDKGGCFDDLHLQCSLNPSTGRYFVSRAVYGCIKR